MSKSIIQFGFKNFTPPEGAAVLDCRCIPNPYKRGVSDELLKKEVRKNSAFYACVFDGMQLIAAHDLIYVGCAFGKHRSGAVAEELAIRTGATITKWSCV